MSTSWSAQFALVISCSAATLGACAMDDVNDGVQDSNERAISDAAVAVDSIRTSDSEHMSAVGNIIPASIGVGGTIIPQRSQVSMKPIPGTNANDSGIARPGDNIAAICAVETGEEIWLLSINRNGHAGVQFANTAGLSHLFF